MRLLPRSSLTARRSGRRSPSSGSSWQVSSFSLSGSLPVRRRVLALADLLQQAAGPLDVTVERPVGGPDAQAVEPGLHQGRRRYPLRRGRVAAGLVAGLEDGDLAALGRLVEQFAGALPGV